VIELLYDFGWQSREVAVEMHVNESRVSQIKQGARFQSCGSNWSREYTEGRMMRRVPESLLCPFN
jgi:hypothetical protein